MNNNGEIGFTPKPLKIFGKIVKWGFIVFAVLVLGWLCLRSIWQSGTAITKRYLWNEDAVKYVENGGELTVWDLTEFNTSDLKNIFYIYKPMYTEELGQFQFSLRYNVYGNNFTQNGFDKDGDFRFELVDDLGNVYTEYEYVKDDRAMYGYYRVIFSDVMTLTSSELKVNIYYEDSLDKCDSRIVWFDDGYKEKASVDISSPKADELLHSGN